MYIYKLHLLIADTKHLSPIATSTPERKSLSIEKTSSEGTPFRDQKGI